MFLAAVASFHANVAFINTPSRIQRLTSRTRQGRLEEREIWSGFSPAAFQIVGQDPALYKVIQARVGPHHLFARHI